MSNITAPNPNQPPLNQVATTGFTANTSKLSLDFNVAELQTKINDVTTRWGEDNLDLSAEAKMWQIRNQNVGKTLESTTQDASSAYNLTGDVTINVPTKDGKELPGWRSMSNDQKEAMWKESISGYKYEQNSEGKWVMARSVDGKLIKSDLKIGSVVYDKMGGYKACDYLYNYEGMTPGTAARAKSGDSQTDIDNARSQNQTMINNILTANSNSLSQATTKSNFGINQLQSSITSIQTLFNDLFNALKQFTNNTTA